MKAFSIMLAAAAVFAAFRLSDDPGAEGRVTGSEAAPMTGVYRLVADGDEACTVKRGPRLSGGLSQLVIGPACRSLLPGIERARFWREGEDGVVTFSENGADPIVAFAAADGAGYESFAPAVPMLSLRAR